jgi:hypothetical protein
VNWRERENYTLFNLETAKDPQVTYYREGERDRQQTFRLLKF